MFLIFMSFRLHFNFPYVKGVVITSISAGHLQSKGNLYEPRQSKETVRLSGGPNHLYTAKSALELYAQVGLKRSDI